MTAQRWAAALTRIEDRLRARGLTGGQAFDRLLPALEARLGIPAEVDPELAAWVEDLPAPRGHDLLGLAYERFFADLFKGRRGQFFTPPAIGRWLVEQLRPREGEVVLDPTCGSGGLLVHAAGHGATVRGMDIDPRLVRLARVNLASCGVPARVERADFFAAEPEPVDVLIANPPFSVSVDDPATLAAYRLAAGRSRVASDVLFTEALGRWVRPGGRAGVVLPWSVVGNATWREARDALREAFHVDAIAALPEGVFRPFGGAAGRAALIWLRRRGPGTADGETRFTTLSDPGYDVRSVHLKLTSDAEIERRLRGGGWETLLAGAWVPERAEPDGVRVGDLAGLRRERIRGATALAELADVDGDVGDLSPRATEVVEARPRIVSGDVVVARLRPELGNVALHHADTPCAGSPEWIVLTPEDHPHWLLHALRSPTWRAALPVTQGQTRPRTTAAAVLDSHVRHPGAACAEAVDRLSEGLRRARREATRTLETLQTAVDRHQAGELDDEGLLAVVRALSG
ncbi:MAG: N-6 DNA methylase [Myxococcales bacterium]|nr:N-6 DNA methylase [Myxococcales bacterium]